jgi:hypothetical protein
MNLYSSGKGGGGLVYIAWVVYIIWLVYIICLVYIIRVVYIIVVVYFTLAVYIIWLVYIIGVVYIVGGSVHCFVNNKIAAIIRSIITDVTLTFDQVHKPCAPPVHIL